MKRLYTFLVSLITALLYAGVVHAVQLQVDYPAVGGEPFSGGGPLAWLRYIYFGAFAVIGIVAFASLVYAGIKWMTSRSEGGVSDAKDRIQKTLLGLLLAGASVLILQLINPDLVSLREPRLPLPNAPDRGEFNNGGPTTGDDCVDDNGIGDNDVCAEENENTYCDLEARECRLAEEASCSRDTQESGVDECGTGLYCADNGPTIIGGNPLGDDRCVPRRTEGETCATDFQFMCLENLFCDDITGGDRCVPKKGVGESCSLGNIECKSGNCVNGECAAGSSSTNIPGTPDGNLSVEISADPYPSAGVDQAINHRIIIGSGGSNKTYSYTINDGDTTINSGNGRMFTGSMTTSSTGFADKTQILNFRTAGTYTVTTTLKLNGTTVKSDSYSIQIGGGINFTPTAENTTISSSGATQSVPPESSSIAQPTGSDISGPTTATTNGQTHTFTFLSYVSPGEDVFIIASVGNLASAAKLVTANQIGTATQQVTVTFKNSCQQGAPSTSGVTLRIQAARVSSDGSLRSAWLVGTDTVNVTVPLCGQ